MSTDEILWKNVEQVKSKQAKEHRHNSGLSRTAKRSVRKSRTASPSRSTNGIRKRCQRGRYIAFYTQNPHHRMLTPPRWNKRPILTRRANERANGRTLKVLDCPVRVPARPALRQPERYSFQFWTDQITRLKKLRQILNMVKDPNDRTEISLSDLARAAMDDYLDRETERINQMSDTA